MRSSVEVDRSNLACAIFGILNPVPYGSFVAALIFDVTYFRTGVVFWDKGAAWLIALGLIIAIVPRFINLAHVWFTARASATWAVRLDFWLNLLAILSAILNAFVHSRDAYSSMPEGLWLSALTVVLLVVSHGATAARAGRGSSQYA